jgi:hypothetical protein
VPDKYKYRMKIPPNNDHSEVAQSYDNDLMINRKPAVVHWITNVIKAEVDGNTIDLFRLVPDTAEVEFYTQAEKKRIRISLKEFCQRPIPGNFDPEYNCHGLTLANKGYWIDDSTADLILKNDYEEISPESITEGTDTIIGFYDKTDSHLCHTCLLKGDTYINKVGIRGEMSSSTFDDIERNYPNCFYKYFIKKK